MIKIRTLIKVFALWTIIGMISKLAFIAIYGNTMADAGVTDYLNIIWHGLRLDVAIAGYLSAVPALLLLISIAFNGRLMTWLWRAWFAFASVAASLAFVSNLGLYGYWGFPLDSTPVMYITTSPKAALASMTTWQLIIAPVAITGVAIVIYRLFDKLGKALNDKEKHTSKQRIIGAVAMLLLTASLIIPIRGGFGTGTNHTGSVYFSADIVVNHAAVNPLFSFFESATHKEDIAGRYRFMDDAEAQKLFDGMTHTALRTDSVPRGKQNVVVVCLESFSKYIMTEAGHVSGVVPNLERYATEGIYFTRFYANSTRTDRALASVISSLPAQPTMSVMDQARISTSLPSIASVLSKEGYNTHFYYGGDPNYSNMKAYLMGTGFKNVTAQYDFPAEKSTGKWGVADGPLFDKVLEDIEHSSKTSSAPFLKFIMTSSSHEPFDVPNYKKLDSPELNAFHYADHCLGNFIEKLKTQPCWKNTLVVIVPDHLGAYPTPIDNYQLWRYEIPLVFLGGMIEQPQQVATIGSQIDINATVLGMLGIAHDDLPYSKDLLDEQAPHFAFFTFPDAMGMIEDSTTVIYDNTSAKLVHSTGANPQHAEAKAKAYLQKLYDDLGKR